MNEYKYVEIRQKYLDLLRDKYNHAIIPSASLVTENDPTLLFINSGMAALVPYLMGEPHPEGVRLANSQRSVRTIDIDSVGDATHCTAFEMLGNWSLDDYFKTEAINITIGFFTDGLGIPLEKLYYSVFEGDKDAPKDEESINAYIDICKKAGLDYEVGPQKRIQLYGKGENWWGLPAGGPCGPNSEIFYDTGRPFCGDECGVACNCGKYIELCNNVFMEYQNTGTEYKPLGMHNVDFGAGLDRLAMISQKADSVFETDIYKPIYDLTLSLAGLTKESMNPEQLKSVRIIVDHIKAASWMIMDGVEPGRTEKEYILRRIMRRAIRHAHKLGVKGDFMVEVATKSMEQFSVVWERLETDKVRILSVFKDEEEKFSKTLQKGLSEVNRICERLKRDGNATFDNSEAVSFKLFETYGFPPEMLIEELEANGVTVDAEKFWDDHKKAFEEHQEKSRSASAGKFKGGLADYSENSTKLHTATHLLIAALRKVVGEHIYQKGSNITPERLRLDFPNDTKLTAEQLAEVENMVNQAIKDELEVSFSEFDKAEALKLVPFAAFDEKYGSKVKVYRVGPIDKPFSMEICGGPHVENTRDLGSFKIVKQENVAAGVKRIKAVVA